jgi:hypothetical protein
MTAVHTPIASTLLPALANLEPCIQIPLSIDGKQWPVNYLGLSVKKEVVVYAEIDGKGKIMFCDPCIVSVL